MMRRLLLFLLLGRAAPVVAQAPVDLPYYSPDTLQVQQLAAARRASVQHHFVVPKTGSGDYREHYRRVAQEAATEVYNSVRYSALLDPVLNPYVQRVFARIVAANPQLPPVQLVLSRSPEPNAHALGDGTVLLNVGLLARLENESQLAFVLCHELAHVQAGHMDQALRDRLTVLHSKEMRQQVRRIVAAEYNISSQLKALVLGLSLGSTYHQRKHEKQADSLGYLLLRRTPYEAAQTYRVLQLLDAIDAPLVAGPLDLPQYFGCAAFPYPGETVAAKPASIFTVKAPERTALETTDTLKSHPDCAKRMRYVRELAQGQVAEGPPAQAASPEFARVQALSRLEVVQSWFDYDCYDHALFEALQLLPLQPQSRPYLRDMIMLCLGELQAHLKGHRFTEVVGNVSDYHPASFNQLLRALYGWQADDYQGLAACFAQGTAAGPPTNEYDLAAGYTLAALTHGAEVTAPLRQQYLAQYPKGRFTRLLFPKQAGSPVKK